MLRRAAVEAERNWGIHVAAHVYDSGGVRPAIDDAVRSIEHANLMDRKTLEYLKQRGVWLSPQVLANPSQSKRVIMKGGKVYKNALLQGPQSNAAALAVPAGSAPLAGPARPLLASDS